MSAGPRRVVLGATRYDEARAGLDLALALASEFRAALRGLLVEEEDFLAFAAHPGARVLGPSGLPLAAVSPDRMLTAIRADAARFRRLLEQSARARGLDWSFSLERGRLLSLLGEQAEAGTELLVLGGEPARGPGGDVILLAAGPPDAALAALAGQAARMLARPLRVLAGPEATPTPMRAALERAASEAQLCTRIESLSAGAVLVAPRRGLSEPARAAILSARCTRLLCLPQDDTTG